MEVDNKSKYLDGTFMVMKSQLQDKLESKDLKALEKKINECAQWDSVRDL